MSISSVGSPITTLFEAESENNRAAMRVDALIKLIDGLLINNTALREALSASTDALNLLTEKIKKDSEGYK
jgi:DNA-binding transcriptional regulator PaaX